MIHKNKEENNDYKYVLDISNSDIQYYCKKLIVATGLSEPNIPNFLIKTSKVL